MKSLRRNDDRRRPRRSAGDAGLAFACKFKPVPKYTDLYAVKRMQCQPTGVWMWRVDFARKGVHYSKGFHEIQYGGSSKARAAVIAWRDTKLTEIEPLTTVEFAEFKLNGKGVHRSLAVSQHGNKKAFQLAVEARERSRRCMCRPHWRSFAARRRAFRVSLTLRVWTRRFMPTCRR